MNYQMYPKFLKGHLSIFGIDMMELSLSLFIGVVFKRVGIISTGQEAMIVGAIAYVIIAIMKKSLPKKYLYFLMTRKVKVEVKSE